MKRILLLCACLVLVAVLGMAPTVARASAPALPPKFSRVALGAGLNSPTAVAFNANRIFVTEKGGAIRIVRANGKLRAAPWATLHVSTQSERGLLGIALDPDFANTGFVYVYYTTGPGAKNYSGTPENRVSRLKKVPNRPQPKEKILLDHIPSTNGNHNGGDIHFGFDGYLYVSVGESGCCASDAQGLDTLRGKILRIGRKGGIPSDNPFYNTPGARRETFAYGFRNPWRFAEHESNSSYIVADVGSGTWEEIDSLQAGGNYGWPRYEGPCPSNNLACNPATVDYGNTIPPIHWYNHHSGDEQGNVIAGGVFVEHSNYPSPYAGAYFYGDTGAGWVNLITLDAQNQVTGHHEFDTGVGGPVSFAAGPDGNLYVVAYGEGVIYRYVYNP